MCGAAFAQRGKGVAAPKPLYRDPVYDGAADPVVVWNKAEKKWFMFYTNRRANVQGLDGVTWVHGTRIGIAESKDGARWTYRDTADIAYRPQEGYTHWAPEVLEHNGVYHMYLTYVPGVFSNWQHPRFIVHLTSANLLQWKYESTLNLVNDKVIDACVAPLPQGGWRMWYNNEKDGKSIYYADSEDLYHWTDKGKVIGDRGEGPKVFAWQGYYWMVKDDWAGLGVYRSIDMNTWQKQTNRLLDSAGTGPEDASIGGHPDVVVSGNRAYVYYFIHPNRNAPDDGYEKRRSLIQVVELKFENGWLTCNRNETTYVKLQLPATVKSKK
jgi:beta-xylosidase